MQEIKTTLNIVSFSLSLSLAPASPHHVSAVCLLFFFLPCINGNLWAASVPAQNNSSHSLAEG